MAKIETAIAVHNLPQLIIHTSGKQGFGVTIARGDLAVEIGYQRLTEIQEEILWLCEAVHVPVIWATQVLESLVKDRAPSRGISFNQKLLACVEKLAQVKVDR